MAESGKVRIPVSLTMCKCSFIKALTPCKASKKASWPYHLLKTLPHMNFGVHTIAPMG
jgi:hypothetical protein